jgi:hypothetical protein
MTKIFPSEESYMEKKTRGRPPKVKPTDWEALSKKLQKALEDEIAENQKTNEECMAMARDLIERAGIIKYLENKLGYDSV